MHGSDRRAWRNAELRWTVGAGAELAFGAWSVKAEYLYYDLGSSTLVSQLQFNGTAFDNYLAPKFETTGNIARVGLSYHFD